jgi:hypothetical protein
VKRAHGRAGKAGSAGKAGKIRSKDRCYAPVKNSKIGAMHQKHKR